MNDIINEIYYNIESIITEGISDITYHFTSINKLLNILKENKFYASTNVGSDADAGSTSKDKPYFFSTQRSGNKKTGWAKGTGSNVSIVLDGRKLNQRYKGFPVDYWGWSKDRKDWDSESVYKQALLSNELEDRIVLDEPTIDNATDYIMEIHIYLDPKDEYATHPDIIKELRRYDAQYRNIPFYFYIESEDFENQNKTKAVNAKELKSNPNAKELRTSNYDRSFSLIKHLTPILSLNNRENKTKVLSYLEDNGKDVSKYIEKLDKDIAELKYLTDWRLDERISSMSAAIHNNRGNVGDTSRFIIKLLVDDMKQYNASNFGQYVKIKTGIEEPKQKEKSVKPVTILWDDQMQDNLSWSQPIWSYVEVDDFWWDTLPSNYRGDLKMVGIINNDNLTFKQFVKQTMPIVGKEKLKKLFAKNEISFKNIASDDNEYNSYVQNWKKS